MAGTCEFVYEPEDDASVPCPHPAHDDTARCVFHLSPDRCEELGITDNEVRDVFLAAVESDDPERKHFYGATFEALDLSGLVIDSGDNQPISFRDATVDHLDLGDSTVRQPLVLNYGKIGSLRAAGAVFERRVSCMWCSFSQPELDIRDTRAFSTLFSQDVSAQFGSASFHRQVDFRGATFEGGCGFARAKFDDEILFDRTTVNGDLDFSFATIYEIDFKLLSATGTLSLDGATLINGGDFDGVIADTISCFNFEA